MKILAPNEVKKIVSEKEFRQRFRDPLFMEILLPLVARSTNGMRLDDLKELAAELENWFYAAARALVDSENEIKMFGKAPKIVRPHRIRLERVLAHLKNAGKELDQAAATAQTEQKEGLKRGILDFRTPRVALRKVATEVTRLRRYVIRHLPADQRTDYENRTIRLSKAATAQDANRRNKFSAPRDEVIMEIAAKLKKITKGRVPDSHINRVISAFFSAIDRGVGIGNVKTIRHRLTLRKQTKGGPASAPDYM
jgi:hypothetical protein